MFYIKLYYGLFSIGGGYAIIPLIQEQVVNYHGWLSIQEYTDIITISQMTPGPLVVNTASFVGIRIAGIPGAVVATFGSILTGFISSVVLFNFFKKYKNIDSIANILRGLRACSVGLIASAAATIILIAFLGTTSLTTKTIDINYIAVIIFLIAFYLLRHHKLNPMTIMALTGITGLFFYL